MKKLERAEKIEILKESCLKLADAENLTRKQIKDVICFLKNNFKVYTSEGDEGYNLILEDEDIDEFLRIVLFTYGQDQWDEDDMMRKFDTIQVESYTLDWYVGRPIEKLVSYFESLVEQKQVIKNLTPHNLNVLDENYNPVMCIQPEGNDPLRVKEEKELLYTINGINVYRTVYGKCDALPPQEKNVFLVVSRMVIDAHPERKDLLCPSEIVRRDADGNLSSHPFAKGDIIGCLSLSR